MDRLNFRKKMAVFISLVMILQVVLCNVGFADGITYTVSFPNNVNGNEITYNVGGEEVTVTVDGATVSGSKVTVVDTNLDNVQFKLGDNFDSSSMEVRIFVNEENGFSTTLSVDENKTTTLNKKTADVLPNTSTDFVLEVVEKNNSSGNSDYTIDLSEGRITEKVITYTVGKENVTITLPNDITINDDNTVKLKEDTVLTLSDNFNAENMQVKLNASDGFSTTLTVNEQKTTSIRAKDCEGLPDATMKLSVVQKKADEL